MFRARLLPAVTHRPCPPGAAGKSHRKVWGAFREPKLALSVCVHVEHNSSGHMVPDLLNGHISLLPESISELTEVVSLPDGPRGFLLKPPQCLLCGSHVVSPPDGGRGLACPLQGVPVAGRALCCHRETAGLAEC